jgi:hypothetical protein
MNGPRWTEGEYSLLLGCLPPGHESPTMSSAANTSDAPLPSVAILGADALLAARPATPVQLAHACQAAGYAAVYPASWGDELLAIACARRVASRGDAPAIFCACPHVSDALLEVGSDLARFLVPLVAPPVACARYLRALYGYSRVRITYIGACPGAHDPAIDALLTPVQFFGVLSQLGVALNEQPEVFESVLPPDRRRHRSMPGGAPTSDTLAHDGDARSLIEIIDDDWKTELAQGMLARHRAVFDVAPALGCHCAGARPGVSPATARPSVVAMEPPRAGSDVIDPNVAVDVDRPLPVVMPHAYEPALAIVAPPPDEPAGTSAPEPVADEPPPPAPSLIPEEISFAETEAPRRKAAAPVVARAAQTVPLARTEGGQVLPRAYAARRRTPPEGAAVVTVAAPEPVAAPVVAATPPPPESPATSEVAPPRATPRSVTVPIPAEELRPVPPPPSSNHTRAAVVTAATTIAIAMVAMLALRDDTGHVTSESSGFAAPVPTVLDSLPPLSFPLPGTRSAAQPVTPESTKARLDVLEPRVDTTPSAIDPTQGPPSRRTARPPARRPSAAARRPARRDSAPAQAWRSWVDSLEREAIRKELVHRRARLDSIARSLEPNPGRPDR